MRDTYSSKRAIFYYQYNIINAMYVLYFQQIQTIIPIDGK